MSISDGFHTGNRVVTFSEMSMAVLSVLLLFEYLWLYDTLYCKLKTMLLKYTYVSVEIIEEIIIPMGEGGLLQPR